MAEYIKRDTAIGAVMAAKWVDGSDGAMAMEIVASPPAADVIPRPRWIPADEELPPEGKHVLCWYEYFRIILHLRPSLHRNGNTAVVYSLLCRNVSIGSIVPA